MFNRIKTSLSARLGFYVLLLSAAIFFGAVILFYTLSRQVVKHEASLKGKALLEAVELHVEHVLHDVGLVVRDMAREVDQSTAHPDSIRGIIEQTVAESDVIVGAIVAFEPGFYPERGRFFAPYIYRQADSLMRYAELGSDDYNYFAMEWYCVPRETEKPGWSTPYFDLGGADEQIITYSYPLLRNGKIYAVCTADVSIQWLSEMLRQLKPYADAETFVCNSHGDFLLSATSDDGVDRTLGRDTIRFETRIPAPEWTIGVICPSDQIFASLRFINLMIVLVLVLGLGLLFWLIRRVVNRQIKPLQEFSRAACGMAAGNFNTPLPQLRYPDEMSELRDSFDHMQGALVDYIDRLTRNTVYTERVEGELRIAMAIQTGVLPNEFPAMQNLNLYGVQQPAREVGGDMYDFYEEDGSLYFIVGDVSGKGVPAALIMLGLVYMFRAVTCEARISSGGMGIFNNVIASRNPFNMFITAFAGVLDLKTGVLEFCNAGHNPPVVKSSSGSAAFLEVDTNIPLGVMCGHEYSRQRIQLEPGAMLVVYTDGVTESEDSAQREFSPERLLSVVEGVCPADSKELVELIMTDVRSHTAGAAQSDDITLLTLQWRPTD